MSFVFIQWWMDQSAWINDDQWNGSGAYLSLTWKHTLDEWAVLPHSQGHSEKPLIVSFLSVFFFTKYWVIPSEKVTHLSTSVDLVGKFDLVEAHCGLHPVSSKVRRVGVDVDAAVTPPLFEALRPASCHPLSIRKLPAAAVGRHKVKQEGVHGAGVQTRHAYLQHWKHSAAWIKHIIFAFSNTTKTTNTYGISCEWATIITTTKLLFVIFP